MNTDFRVSTGWLDHPKTSRLIARCGRDGAFSLLALWSWAARVLPTGNLGAMTDEEIETAAKWEGEPGRFAGACRDIGWLDVKPDGIRIHGWKEHNGYASGAATRIRSARHAVNERWRKARERKDLIRPHILSSSSLPSPSLSVSKEEEEEHHVIPAPSGSGSSAGADLTLSHPVQPRSRRKKPAAEPTVPVPMALNGQPWGTPLALAALWNEKGPPECPAIELLTDTRADRYRDYLRRFPERKFWEETFAEVGKSRFLRGLENTKDRKPIARNLDWLCQRGKDDVENCLKTWEGKYRG